MKTNTTRKVSLVAVLLLLIAILTADYYHNGRRNIGKGQESPVVSNITHRQTRDISGILNNNALNSTPVYADASVAPQHTRRHVRNHHNTQYTAGDMNVQRASDYNAIAVNNPKKQEPFIHQTSKDHYGYTTANEDVPGRAHRIHLGIELGYNLSSLNQSQSTISRGGFHAGGIMDIAFGKHFALQPAILYSVKGTRFQSMLDVENKEKLTLHYIEVPLNAVFKIGKVDNTQFLLGVGPYFSYLLNAKDNFQSSNPADGSTLDVIGYVPETPNYPVNRLHNFDYGIGGFIGAQVPEGFFIKAGGELGLTDVQQPTNAASGYRNYNLSVSAGYFFGY